MHGARHIDVFNGDADGLCALAQLRLSEPLESTLITGVKRDISLLARVRAGAGDRVTVLDVALEKNRQPLLDVLAAGARVLYIDHHHAGEIPEHPNLNALINTAPSICTSLLANGLLHGAHAEWAVAGAFGDNLEDSATRLAASARIEPAKVESLRQFGERVNYNGYGEGMQDLRVPPDELFRLFRGHKSPLDFMRAEPDTWALLDAGYLEDVAHVDALRPYRVVPRAKSYVLPNEAWARRIGGTFANRMARDAPQMAHCVVTERHDGTWLVSVRAPLANPTGADQFCLGFPTGGGRASAGGINRLPADMLDEFMSAFEDFFSAKN